MLPCLTRRRALAAGLALAAPALPAVAVAPPRRFEPHAGRWRRFEVSTRIEVAEPAGRVRLWLPVPGVRTDYQRPLGNRWSGNASRAHLVADAARGVQMLYAEFDAGVPVPRLTLTSWVETRGREVDWQRRRRIGAGLAALRAALQPTELLPLDGIVHDTARQATRGATRDLDKVRAIYDWVVAHAHRDPAVRGCGVGDIVTMLETGNLGGKCADLNALFVGLCRASGVPARDVYGLRVAPSAFGYTQLGANPARLEGAQHCRAEVFLAGHGWVAMDPADVLKVMRHETPRVITEPSDPVVAPVNAGLFGGWEGNWVGWNTAHDVHLPGTAPNDRLPFLMYPVGENRSGRFDSLAPDAFRYTISARELTA